MTILLFCYQADILITDWYDPDGIANILPFKSVRARYNMTLKENATCFVSHREGLPNLHFDMTDSGLFVLNVSGHGRQLLLATTARVKRAGDAAQRNVDRIVWPNAL